MNFWVNVCPNCRGKRFEVFEADDDNFPGNAPSVSVVCVNCGWDWMFHELEIEQSSNIAFPNTTKFVNGVSVKTNIVS